MTSFDVTEVREVRLSSGSHTAPEQGMCFMEMVAWFAGEEHSDRPACACPILGGYGITLNDAMPDEMRDRLLKPLVPLIAGTRGTPTDELARAKFLALWGVNKLAPIYLRAYGEFLRPADKAVLDALASQCEAARSDAELQEIARADLAARAARAALAARAARAALAALADLAALAALARNQIFELMVEGLRQAITIGPHEGFDQALDLTSRHEALRELVGPRESTTFVGALVAA
jgi:hypothetical protein